MTSARTVTKALVGVILAATVLGACSARTATESDGAWAFDSVEALPSPGRLNDLPLVDALEQRRSARDFAPEALSPSDIASLLWAAQGLTADWGGRTAPSAGALYPLELFLVTDSAVRHYVPEGHRVEVRDSATAKVDLAAAIGQDAADEAAGILVIAAVPERVEPKYAGRAERFIAIEAGHAAQNLLLAATALGLAGVPLGSFPDAAVADVLGLPDSHEVVYTLALGYPAEPGA